MAIPQHLSELATHMAWADAVIWRAVLRSEPGRSDPRLLAWLHHVHVVQRAFLQVWKGETPRLRELSEFVDAATLCRWGREGHEAYGTFWSDTPRIELEREIRLPWAGEFARTLGRKVGHPTLHETALQVAMHSAHHRGQASARLRELGGDPPLSDYIGWIWWERPAPDWSFLDASLS